MVVTPDAGVPALTAMLAEMNANLAAMRVQNEALAEQVLDLQLSRSGAPAQVVPPRVVDISESAEDWSARQSSQAAAMNYSKRVLCADGWYCPAGA